MLMHHGNSSYVVLRGRGQTTGSSFGVPMWVDWQTCGEIAGAEDDGKGKWLYRILGMFHLISVIGGILLICGV